jgi:hypothetical protein
MGFDVALGELVGSLFFGADAAAAAAPEVAAGAADLGAAAGLGVADIAPGAGLAADLGAGLGAGAEAGAGAADIAGAGIGAADLAGAAGAAADLGAGIGAAAADVPSAVDTLASAGLGENVGGAGVTNALSFAPTADTAAGAAPGAAGAGATTASLDPAALVGSGGGTQSASAELAAGGSPSLNATLGADTAAATPVTEPTTAQAAFASNPTQFTNNPFTAETGAALSPDTTAALASAPPTTAGAAGGGLTSTLSSALNSPYTKLAELGLPLGFLGYNLAKGPPPIAPQANLAVANAENQLAPLQGKATANTDLFNQTAATDLNLANNFQISPAQAASISIYQQDSMNQLYQQIAKQGNTDPTKTSEFIQGKQQIDQQALAMQVQMVNQLISTAFQASGAATSGLSAGTNVTNALDQTLMQAAQLQVQQDSNFQNAVGSALQSFGLMAALSGRFGSSNTGATA